MRGSLILLLLVLPLRALAGTTDDPDTDFAKRKFAEGSAFYEKGDYEHALEAFRAARTAKPLPAFEFNIGRCLDDRLGRWREALEAYEHYIAGATTEDTSEVMKRLEELRQRVEREKTEAAKAPPPTPPPPQQQAPPPPAPPPSTTPPRTSLVLPIAVGAGTLIVGAVAAALLLSVGSDFDDLTSGPHMCPGPCTDDQINALKSRADLGYALVAVAGVALAADVYLFARALRRRSAEAHALVVPTLGGAAIAGAF